MVFWCFRRHEKRRIVIVTVCVCWQRKFKSIAKSKVTRSQHRFTVLVNIYIIARPLAMEALDDLAPPGRAAGDQQQQEERTPMGASEQQAKGLGPAAAPSDLHQLQHEHEQEGDGLPSAPQRQHERDTAGSLTSQSPPVMERVAELQVETEALAGGADGTPDTTPDTEDSCPPRPQPQIPVVDEENEDSTKSNSHYRLSNDGSNDNGEGVSTEEEEWRGALVTETAEDVGAETSTAEDVEIPPPVPGPSTVDSAAQNDEVSVCAEAGEVDENDASHVDGSEETMGERADPGGCGACNESAETLPMADGDTRNLDAGFNDSSSMGLPFLSPATKMVQRAVMEGLVDATTSACIAEPKNEEVEEEGDAQAISDDSMCLSPETRLVHQQLVEGCTTDIDGVVGTTNAEDTGANGVIGPKDEQGGGDVPVRHSGKMTTTTPSDQRNTSMNSVYTDDGMGAELTNLNAIEDEIRREVESPRVEIKAATASPRRNRTAAGFADEDTPSRRSSAGASSNGGSSPDAVGGTSISNAVEQLQQQVGAMAREALLSRDSGDENDSTFVPLRADPKQISFMSDADDGMDDEVKKLSEAENESRKDVSEPQIEEAFPGGSEQEEGVHKEIGGPPVSPPTHPSDDSDPSKKVQGPTSSNADGTVPASPTSPPGLRGEEEEAVMATAQTPATSSLVASSDSLADSQPTPPSLTFQECIELERWGAVLRMLDTDHGKVARQDVYITSGSTPELGDDEDDTDYVEEDVVEGRLDSRYRRKATALHLACTRDPPLDVVKRLIQTNPEAVSSPTRLGWEYPLHYAVGSGMASDSVINVLAETCPDAVSKVSTGAARFGAHQSPLHLAVTAFLRDTDASPSLSVLRTMCRRKHDARKVRDGSGRTPLELATQLSAATCPQDLKKILSPSNDINEMIVFRVKSLLLAILVVGAAWFLKKLEHFGAAMVNRAEETFAEVVSMGSSGLAVAFCICIIALLVVNTTRIIQQDKAQHPLGDDEDETASDEFVTILYVSAVGLIVLFATEPVTLLLHTTVVTGCALGYILLRRSKKGPMDDNANLEFLDCRDREIHGSMSDTSLKDSAGKGASREYDMTPLERDGMCIVCWERPADHVLVPCGHLCLCAEVSTIEKSN